MLKHISHGLHTHRVYYQQLHTVIERVGMAKLLTVIEMGRLKDYAGKSLEDIDFEGKGFKWNNLSMEKLFRTTIQMIYPLI